MKKRFERGFVFVLVPVCVFLLLALLIPFFGTHQDHSVTQARLNDLEEAYRGRTYNYILVDWGPESYSEVVEHADAIVTGTVSTEPETIYKGMFKWFKFSFQTKESLYADDGNAFGGEEITIALPNIDYGAKELFTPGTKLLMLLTKASDFDESGIFNSGVTHTFYLTEDEALFAMLSHPVTSGFNGWYLKRFRKYIKDLRLN